MSQQFKVEDIVKCVNISDILGMHKDIVKKDEVYTVAAVSELNEQNIIRLVGIQDRELWFYSYRFVLIEMNTFKPGDVVRCVDSGAHALIKFGDLYVVESCANSMLSIKNCGIYHSWRFVPVPWASNVNDFRKREQVNLRDVEELMLYGT